MFGTILVGVPTPVVEFGPILIGVEIPPPPPIELNLYVVDYDEEYRSGSMLIVATDLDQAEQLMQTAIRPGEWSVTGPTLVPGKITGVQPSVLHDYRYIE